MEQSQSGDMECYIIKHRSPGHRPTSINSNSGSFSRNSRSSRSRSSPCKYDVDDDGQDGRGCEDHHIIRGGRRKRKLLSTVAPLSRLWVVVVAIVLSGARSISSTKSSVDFSSIISASYLQSYTDYVFKFEHNSYNVTIPENSMGKTYVQQLTADLSRMGIHIRPGIDVKYRIMSGDKEKLFKVDERIVGDFAFLTVRTRTGNVILNREKVEEYRLAVRAVGSRRDEKNTKLSWESETMINVRVLDRNDLSPLFYPTDYSATVPEDMPLHKSILQVHAEDADLGINGEIYYSFYDKHLYEHLSEETSSGAVQSSSDTRQQQPHEYSDLDQFAIHPISGVITLTRPLSFIDRPFFELFVIATDRGVHSQPIYKRINHASKALVRINVTQVNLHAPSIYVRKLPEILEDSATHIFGIVNVEDMDAGRNGQINSLEITAGDPDGHFRIRNTGRREYNIELHSLLDRESTPNGYNLTLRATDNGVPPRSTYKVIPVKLADKNDNAPVFNKALYEVSVPESAPVNSPIIRLKVSDADEGRNAKVFLEIVGGNEGGEFRINPETGMLYTARVLDAESQSMYTLTVSAIDQGNTGTRKQSSARVKISVMDINDNDPVFEHSNMTVWIDENEPAGTTVTKVSARDKDSGDNSYISYSIANINQVPFDVDAFTGIIRTAKLIDYETMRRQYVLKIRASDWGRPYRRQTEMELFINVRDVNDNRPQFERVDCVGEVYKLANIGDEVLTVNAIDFDAGSEIEFRMVSGNEDGCFNLDSTSGVISVGCELSQARYNNRELNITATDGTHFSDVMRVQFTLTENKLGYRGAYTNPLSSVSGDVTAKGMHALFECRETGVIHRHAEMLASAERNNMPALKGASGETGSGDARDDFLMLPSRYRENIHSPEFIDFPSNVRINETIALGKTVAWIRARDRDLGYNGKLIYGISDGDYDSVFRIDPDTGELKIIGYLDREREDEYLLNVTVYDLGIPQKSVSKVLPVTVLDENDNPPKFAKTLFNFRLAEDTAVGTFVARLNATDADTHEFAGIRYYLLTDTADFQIDSMTGVLTVANKLDREQRDVYELIVRATDGGGHEGELAESNAYKSYAAAHRVGGHNHNSNNNNLPSPYDTNILHADALIRIIVDDVNDNAPQFSADQYKVRVREDVPIGSVIVAVNAMDKDLGDGGDVQYRFADKCDFERDQFRIDRLTGTVRLARALDFEERQSMTLCVQATDKGNPPLSSEVTILVEVIDVNENLYTPQFEDFVLTGDGNSVRENQPVGTYVMNINVRDNDPPGPDSRVAYSIRGGDGLGLFSIDNEGAIKTTAVFDIETKQFYWLTVCAQDHGIIPLYSCAEVFIEILNENDNVPLTERPAYFASVPEGSPAGTNVLQLVADDDDIDPNQKIHFKIVSGDPEGHFFINSSTGMISTTARKLDRELQEEHTFEVVLTDNGTPRLSSTTRVVITVLDVNDNGPEFQQKFYKAQIPKTAKIDDKLYQRWSMDTATSTTPLRRGFRSPPVASPATTTTSTTRATLNDKRRDVQKTASLPPATTNDSRMIRSTGSTFQSSSSSSGAGAPAAALVPRVSRSSVNGSPNASSFSTSAASDQWWKFDEEVVSNSGSSSGPISWESSFKSDLIDFKSLFRVLAYDADVGENGRISYSMKAGKGKHKFRLDADTGVLYAAPGTILEAGAEYNLVIRAEDNGQPRRYQTARMHIIVVDIPDEPSAHAPIVKDLDKHVEVTENEKLGFLVTLIQGLDEDDDFLWYDIVGGDSRNEFFIGHDNGNVHLAKHLDWELQQEYNITIAVSDGHHTTHTSLYVSVLDVNDNRPEFSEAVYKVDISESVVEGTTVLQLMASDKDEDRNLMYYLETAKNPVSLKIFRVDSMKGTVVLQERLDREQMSKHVLIVSVRDQRTPFNRNYATIEITVHDHNDHAPEFIAKLMQGKIYETAAEGSMVLQILAMDRDSGENGHITYSIDGGNVGNVFQIDPQLGFLRLNKALDLRAGLDEFLLQVKATDNGRPRLSSQIPVHIMVNMADNAPPRFVRDDTTAEIYENSPEGTFVTDIEALSASSLLFEIVDGNVGDVFFINPSVGVVTVKNNLDFERQKFYNLTIQATNMASASTKSFLIVHVLDQNDNAPQFDRAEFQGTVSEAAPIGSLILAVENGSESSQPLVIKATDADSGVNALLHFEIVEQMPRRFFHIDSTTGAIRTVTVLDHEKIPAFDFHVTVSDLGKPHLTSETTAKIKIVVTDVNDSSPKFSQPEYNATLILPTYKNIAVAQLNATDPDTNMAQTTNLRYDIIDGNKDQVFQIDAETGLITTRNVERIGNFYRLQVRVSDGLFSTTTYVNVVVETSENSGLVFQKSVYEGSVLENSTKVATVAVVNVLGTVLNEHVQFRILNPTNMFEIGLTSGVIKTTGLMFDRESQDHYELIVEAKSNEYNWEKVRIAHGVVNVRVIDVNDNCPLFVNLPYYAVVSVDDPRGSVIIKVHAMDLDADENGSVRYEMKRGYGELFRVDRQTGEVSLKQTLEGHNRYYDLVIAAYDSGVHPCSSDVPVHVKVIDRSMPVFGKQFYSDSVPENVELYSPLSVAIQAESPLERKLIYTIVRGNDLEEFSIDYNTGVIYVVDELDYERKHSYDLIVRATDSISGVFADVPVAVVVEDVNDCAPEFEQDNYTVSVSESSLFGTAILKVVANDNDTGVSQQIHYSIQTDNRNTSEHFHIDASEGTIYLKKSLDHEAQARHHFVVVAQDRGMPVLTAKAHVWVNVVDMNDNAPKFEQSSYSCYLSEHAMRGQFITVVAAWDPDSSDQKHLVYNIAHGNEMQTYAIEPMTGMITLAANMQGFIERKAAAAKTIPLSSSSSHGDELTGGGAVSDPQQYSAVLNVSVSDGVYTSFARVKINILPANLHNPVFSQSVFDATVDENQLPGRLVYTVLAKDSDFGEYGAITYDITSDMAKEIFAIDGDTGQITTKVRLDREAKALYELPLIATDGGGRSGFSTLKVHVGDENDNAPLFVHQEYKAVIYSNTTPEVHFMRLRATDADDNQNAAIRYSIYDSQNAGVQDLFKIDERTGGMSLRKTARKWENQLFQFFVRAHDNGQPQLHNDVPVDVYIMSPSEVPPVFEKKDKDLFLSESSPPGTLISRVKLVGGGAQSTSTTTQTTSVNGTGETQSSSSSSPAASTPTTRFRVVPSMRDKGEEPMFTVNENGELRLGNRPLDRELVDFYAIAVLAETDSSPPLTAMLEINVHVQDENDNVPVFECESYMLTVAENLEKGATVLRVHAVDADIKTNGDVKYSFGTSAAEFDSLFHIDENTGAITTLGELDRERRANYKFQVVATDQNHPKYTARALVWLQLKDYNDNPPLFGQDKYMASVSENSLPGTVVLQFSVADADEIATPTEYYIASGNTAAQFHIRDTGELYVAKPLDRESEEDYHLEVIVSDGRFSTVTNLSINVEDANDNPLYCTKYRYRESVSEGVHLNTRILSVATRDDDLMANTKTRFFLTGTGAEDFDLDTETGELRVAKQLDRETQSRYYLEALVQDREHTQWNCSSLIELQLLDINDNSPEFSLNTYAVSMSEAAEMGTLVTKVHATDRDQGANRRISYEFEDGAEDQFKIVPDFGIITLNKPLDRETQAAYSLKVVATDHGTPQLSSTTTVLVNVQDINDNPPEFMSKHYYVSIPEITASGSEIITVEATSLDAGVNAEVAYSIISGNEQKKFAIHNKTGAISVADTLDFERSPEFVLTIQAIDGGVPPLSNLATVNISITDSNDNAPVFAVPAYVARIREDAQVGDLIIQVQAGDIDSGANGKVVYQIERGDRQNQFKIDSDSGYISVAANLDRESVSSYVLQVSAVDQGEPPLSSFVLVNIEVSDANDNPPKFTESGNYTTVVKEDRQLGAVVLKFDITDNDMSPNGAPYTFDIRAGNEMGHFRLEQDGVLRTASRFNHKVCDSYTLQIRVFDNGTPPLFSDTFVSIKVIEESQYPPVITPLEVSINSYKDEYKGGMIGKVFATDQDAYDNLIYRLVPTTGAGYDSASLFKVSETDGVITALSNLDIGRYHLNVSVSDGKFTANSVVKVTVDLVSEEMVKNAVIIRFRDVSPKEFLMSHKKQFARSIQTVMGMRILLKDVVIISVQQSDADLASNMIQSDNPLNGFIASVTHEDSGDEMSATNNGHRFNQHQERRKRRARQRTEAKISDLDVLFAVRKMHASNNGTSGSGANSFYTREEVLKALDENVDEIEGRTKLRVDAVVKTNCDASVCGLNGRCLDRTELDGNKLETIAIDVNSFVSARFFARTECKCREGYGGEYCTEYVNECARNPCPSFQICTVDRNEKEKDDAPPAESFKCQCPEGFTGPTCQNEVSKCNNDVCFTLRKPITFSGKSFAHYKVEPPYAREIVQDQLSLSLLLRTTQQSANLMYSAGKIDFNILEIHNGIVQYRFDLGSGEGIVSVASVSISDGQWHEVRLDRQGNSAKLYVDAKHTAQGSAPGVNGVLNVQSNDIYFGAELREHPKIIGFEDLRRGFIGCLDKITIAKEVIPMYKTHAGTGNRVLLQKFTNIDFSCNADVLKPVGVCDNYPCLNGGTCKATGGGNFNCLCHSRFSGPLCKEDLDPCSSAPCLYGGTCRADTSGNFTCECPSKMTGKRCDYGRFCLPNPCRNGGICEEGDTEPICKCRGYSGPTCENDIDECLNQPCDNGATCSNEPGSFRCICPPNLTGSNCGDPMYSNTIRSRIFSAHNYVLFGSALIILVILFVTTSVIICVCKRRRRRRRMSPGGPGKYDGQTGIILNPTDCNNRNQKMSNLEAVNQQRQRPVSYTPNAEQVPLNNAVFVNNLDTLRSYGSAGDELGGMMQEYTKETNANQLVNMNSAANTSDESHKQLADGGGGGHSKQFGRRRPMSPQSGGGAGAAGGSMSSGRSVIKSSGVLPGKLLTTSVQQHHDPSPSPPISLQHHHQNHQLQLQQQQQAANYEESTYHWDCSDWVRRSQNPLPNITSVPGNEVADTSSFHSNESNESQPMLTKQNGHSGVIGNSNSGIPKMVVMVPSDVLSGGGGQYLPLQQQQQHNHRQYHHPQQAMMVDPLRDIDTLNEEENGDTGDDDLETTGTSDQMGSHSEFENFDTNRKPIHFANSDSINCLSRLDSGASSDDYQYNTGSNLSPYPNAYLLPYNIQSETEYDSERGGGRSESAMGGLVRNGAGGGSGAGKASNKPMNSDMSQQIIDSAAEDGATTGQEEEEDEDDIPSYGFPSQPPLRNKRNRCEATDIDQLISDGGECESLLDDASSTASGAAAARKAPLQRHQQQQLRRQKPLSSSSSANWNGSGRNNRHRDSVSNQSVQLCEIEDSECELSEIDLSITEEDAA